MAKKPISVTLRKPSSAPPSEAPEARDRDAFVEGGRAGYRSITLFLPEVLADRLALHCRETDRDVSALVSEIVQRHLDGALEPEPVFAPAAAQDHPVAQLVKWVQEKVGRVTGRRPAWLFRFA